MAFFALIAVTGAAWVGGYLDPLLTLSGSCSKSASLTVVTDPSVFAGVRTVAKTFDAARTDCVKTVVRSQDSADTSAVLASGAVSVADVWIPDSSVWLDRMAATATSLGRSGPAFEVGKSIVSTPVVFAAPANRASAFGLQPVSWTAILGGTVDALLPDPEASSTSLAGLFALRSHASPSDPRQFAGALIALGKTIPKSPDAAFITAESSVKPTVVVTTERTVALHNDSDPDHPLVALYPADGTTSLGYPFVALTGLGVGSGTATNASSAQTSASLATPDSAKARIIDAFSSALASSNSVFAKEGFRAGNGQPLSRLSAWSRSRRTRG